MTETFQDKFCRHHHVPVERFGEVMLQRTLFWHARWLRRLCPYDTFAADRTFIASVGRLTRRRDFAGEVTEYREDDRNLSFARRHLRLRVSSIRMQSLFRQVWPDPAAGRDRTPAGAAATSASRAAGGR